MRYEYRIWDSYTKSYTDDCYCDTDGKIILKDHNIICAQEYFTVELMTNKLDKNDNPIFENDRVMGWGNVVEYSNSGFSINGDIPLFALSSDKLEVLGTIHDTED